MSPEDHIEYAPEKSESSCQGYTLTPPKGNETLDESGFRLYPTYEEEAS